MIDESVKKFVAEQYKKRFPQKNFEAGNSTVPPSGKIFDEKELEYAIEAVLEGWWTDGKWNLKLEKQIADYIGTKFCATTNSGSSSNLIAFATLTSHLLKDRQVKPSDEVITVAAGFPTTINPIITYGCVPVFIDVDLDTLEVDVSKLEEARSEKTKAVMIAHTLGNTMNLEAIKAFCDKHKLWFIEDTCDALGSTYKGKKAGTFGDISTISFYPAHHITTAEGGAVLTDHPLLNKIIRSIRDWGRDCWCPTGKDDTCCMRFKWKLGNLPEGYDHKYIYSHIGYNLKITDLQAAIGVAQMEKVDHFVQARKDNYKKIRAKLEEFSEYIAFGEPTEHSDPSWFGFIIRVKDDAPFGRKELVGRLNENKIGTRQVFAGNITKQPYFVDNEINYRVVGELKNSDTIMKSCFWIGVYPGITHEMIDHTYNTIKNFINEHK